MGRHQRHGQPKGGTANETPSNRPHLRLHRRPPASAGGGTARMPSSTQRRISAAASRAASGGGRIASRRSHIATKDTPATTRSRPPSSTGPIREGYTVKP